MECRTAGNLEQHQPRQNKILNSVSTKHSNKSTNMQQDEWRWNWSLSFCLHCTSCTNSPMWLETALTAVYLELVAAPGHKEPSSDWSFFCLVLKHLHCVCFAKKVSERSQNISHVKHFASPRLFITHHNRRTNSPMPFFRGITWISKNLQGSLHQLTPLHKLSQHSTFC